MRKKRNIFAVLAVVLVLTIYCETQAVSTRKIDLVRNKAVLGVKDFHIIDNFVAEAVKDLLQTKDFADVARARTVLSSRNCSKLFQNGDQGQYAHRFSEATYKYISEGFEQALGFNSEDRKFKTILNLLILIDNLEDIRLTDLSMEWLNDENMVLRYWAVRGITNDAISEQLNSNPSSNSKLAVKIIRSLEKIVDNSSTEVVALVAEFAAKINASQGEDLLLRIVDMRMKEYADWTVEYELLDGTILKLLYEKLRAGSPKPSVARRFAQLYSYVMQRYIKGQDVLSATQKHYLVSVMAETEKYCIGKLLGMPQSVIKMSLSRKKMQALSTEHSRLCGDEKTVGRLALKLGFDYGKNTDGSTRIAPLALSEPPKTKAGK